MEHEKSKNEKIIEIVLNALVVFFCLFGLFGAYFENGQFVTYNTTLLYFTTQSNIWIAVMCLVFLVLNCIELKTGRNLKKGWLYILKFIFTVAISLTFIVFGFILTPAGLIMNKFGIDHVFTLHSLSMHFFAPVIAICDFIFFDYEYTYTKFSKLLTIVTPFYYMIFTIICHEAGLRWGKSHDAFPYFFADYDSFGWFGFENGMGVIYWIIIIFALVIGMGYGLLGLQKLAQKRYKNDEIQNQ